MTTRFDRTRCDSQPPVSEPITPPMPKPASTRPINDAEAPRSLSATMTTRMTTWKKALVTEAARLTIRM